MAKLTNVKTVDMVNGEITTVSYEGAEYAKCEATRETAKVGDLFLATSERKDITVGAYYEVIYDKHDRNAYSDVTILDDANVTHDIALQYGNFFRKISDASPTIEERVTALEYDVAALKSGEQAEQKRLTVGDFATVIANASSHSLNIGDVIEITIDENDHMPYKGKRVSDGKISLWIYESDLESAESPKYVPQVGDIVVVTANTSSSRNAVGDIGKLSDVSSYDAMVNVPNKPKGPKLNGNYHRFEDFRKATPAEVEQYEKAVHKASFVVGDYVKLTKSEHGDVDAIAKIIEEGSIKTRHVDGSLSNTEFKLEHLTGKFVGKLSAGNADGLVKATDAEVAEALKPKLKAGDFVKFKRSIADTVAGKAYLIEYNEKYEELQFRDDAGDWCDIGATGEYEIVDAETAKWAKIGRQPNEFKEGDVVRVNSGRNFGHKSGTIGVLVSGASFAIPREFGVKANGETFDHTSSGFELIAPVESLFNANA